MGAKYSSLLYYCEVRWLSRAEVIQRVLQLKHEIAIFLDENHNEDSNMFRDDNFIVKLAYLVEIFGKFSVFNKPMQGPQMHLLMQKDKSKSVCKKVESVESKFAKKQP